MAEIFTPTQEYIQQGRMLLSADKYQEAVASFEKAIEANPTVVESYFGLGEAYVMMDNYVKAKELFSKVLLIDKENGEAYFHLGNVELLMQNVEEGKLRFAKAVNCGYDNAQIYINLAATSEEANDYTQALTYYNKAIARDKRCVPAKVRKAEIYVMMGKPKEALQAADSLIETNPEVFEGHHYKFAMLLELGRVQEAEASINFAMKMFPDDSGFLFDKTRLLATQKKYDEALALLDQGFPSTPEASPGIQRERAKLLLAQGKETEALCILEESMRAHPDSATAYMLNMTYMSRKEYSKVVDCCRQVMEQPAQEPHYYSAVYFHALALSKEGKQTQAQKAFRTAADTFRMACAVNPGLIDLYIYRAICHKELGDYDKAMELCEYITTIAPDVAEGYLIRAEIYKVWNDFEKAEADRKTAMEKNPKLAALLN